MSIIIDSRRTWGRRARKRRDDVDDRDRNLNHHRRPQQHALDDALLALTCVPRLAPAAIAQLVHGQLRERRHLPRLLISSPSTNLATQTQPTLIRLFPLAYIHSVHKIQLTPTSSNWIRAQLKWTGLPEGQSSPASTSTQEPSSLLILVLALRTSSR